MATPLIRTPQLQGGTMYAFASAARDLTRAYYNPDINYEYSKFALLDIPVVDAPVNNDNYIEYTNLFDVNGLAYNLGGIADMNIHFANTFQNYALNLENFIHNDDDFDPTLLVSDAEQIFFKWLNHLGGVRFRAANSQEVSTGYSRYIEHDNNVSGGTRYNRVVQYIGDIDVSNDKTYQGNTYNEVFINVPSSVGYTPTVLFEATTFNTNDITYTPLGNYINGRNAQTHPDSNLSLFPVTDAADGKYHIDPSQQPIDGAITGIDFEPGAYSKIQSDVELDTVLDYSKRGGDFRFNAILVYYDLYSKSNPGNRATNLYGVIILDNWKDDPNGTGYYIPELQKYKPDEITGLNGNAFALKLNIKFNSSLDNVGVENNINDYSTFSMDIFLDTTSALESAAQLLTNATNRYAEIAAKVEKLETIVLTSTQIQDVENKVTLLTTQVENAALNYATPSTLLDLLTGTNERLNQLIDGTISSELQYNTDVLKAGPGIELLKTNNKININNKIPGYSSATVFPINKVSLVTSSSPITSIVPYVSATSAQFGILTKISRYTNLVKIYTDTLPLTEDFDIYLDDSFVNWEVGQIIKLVFRTKISLGATKSIRVYTDKAAGWVLKAGASVPSTALLSTSPYIEIICVDEINKTFEIDIIR
tara:strand:- start:3654 stop:5603 length:1950 start_codon:yes stop_codon:yes gene_type:complete